LMESPRNGLIGTRVAGPLAAGSEAATSPAVPRWPGKSSPHPHTQYRSPPGHR
jgi:hypothetical protein